MKDKIQVTKLDAARRQLITAIRLYFADSDIVSIHTLTAAAYQITRAVCESDVSLPKSFSDLVSPLVKDEWKKKIWAKLNETANFFKHADHDPSAVHSFRPEQTETLLFTTVYQYEALTKDRILETRLYSIWFRLQYPEGFNLPPEAVTLGKTVFRSRQEFYQMASVLLMQTSITI